MRNCFVPWCDNECRKNPKRMMFNAPKDEKLFEKWSEVLPKKRPFKKGDKVCERHFTSTDISTTFDHVIDGQLFKMPRGRPKLNENVIPSRNLPAIDDEIKPIKRGRRPSSTKKTKLLKEIDTKLIDALSPIELAKENDIQKLVECCSVAISNNEIEKEKIKNIDEIGEETTNDGIEFFENIYEDIFEVVLPNTLWGIHRDPKKEFVAFSYYDPKLRKTTKVVELTNKAILKIIMCSKILSEENYNSEITIFDSITNILNDTDQVRLCKMAMENIELCQIKLINTDLNEEYCQMCSQLKYC